MTTRATVSTLAALWLAVCNSPAPGPAQPPPPAVMPTAPTPAAPVAPAAFDRTLELQGVTFRVTCPNATSMNALTVVPSGLTGDNRPITREVDGLVTSAEVADLDSDGSPELYVFVRSAGSGSYGSLAAWSANRRRSLSQIALPPVAEDPKVSKGYMGHDAFALVGNRLVQRFPVYRPGDSNASPSGGIRQLHYRLVPGEAGWVLRIDKVEEP